MISLKHWWRWRLRELEHWLWCRGWYRVKRRWWHWAVLPGSSAAVRWGQAIRSKTKRSLAKNVVTTILKWRCVSCHQRGGDLFGCEPTRWYVVRAGGLRAHKQISPGCRAVLRRETDRESLPGKVFRKRMIFGERLMPGTVFGGVIYLPQHPDADLHGMLRACIRCRSRLQIEHALQAFFIPFNPTLAFQHHYWAESQSVAEHQATEKHYGELMACPLQRAYLSAACYNPVRIQESTPCTPCSKTKTPTALSDPTETKEASPNTGKSQPS